MAMQLRLAEKARAFHDLHRRGNPLILFNIWDPGSALAVANAGARALATGSWSVASAFGFSDGEQTPLDLVLGNLERIVRAVALPLTADLEMGYGVTPADVSKSIGAVLARGVVGFNIEDGLVGGGLRSIGAQVERLDAARKTSDGVGVPAFLNARIDVFLQSDPSVHRAKMSAAIERMQAFAGAGANGIFLPGLTDLALIEQVCATTTLPVNVMSVAATPPVAALTKAGVSRVSHGPGPYAIAMKAIETAARDVLCEFE
jgi:2-methylisocitrate lyase-like PEP mutase family enzyme